MPFGMASCQTVMIGGNVYLGGGDSYVKKRVVMVYKIDTESWEELPSYESHYFGMAAVNNQLVLVGGVNKSTGKTTNVLGVWDEGSQTWTHPFPEMPTSRHSTSVVSYQRWLVVAGGDDGRGFSLKKVELLDTHSKQWYEGSPLPKECSQMSSTINGNNMWYLSLTSGYYSFGRANKRVFSVCLDELISQAVLSSTGVTTSPWQALTDTPCGMCDYL